jgi:hypothetical protein
VLRNKKAERQLGADGFLLPPFLPNKPKYAYYAYIGKQGLGVGTGAKQGDVAGPRLEKRTHIRYNMRMKFKIT